MEAEGDLNPGKTWIDMLEFGELFGGNDWGEEPLKHYLVEVDSIPPSAILIEPRARHTTTNFRNAERLMLRYGIHADKAALCVTTKDQADYIMNDGFDRRNIRELGYVPYREKRRISVHEISFYPVEDCLEIDPVDPLDP